jgi:hypothetical protein
MEIKTETEKTKMKGLQTQVCHDKILNNQMKCHNGHDVNVTKNQKVITRQDLA